MPDRDEGPFLFEEKNLLNAIAERLGRISERKQAEENLARLSQQNKIILCSTAEGVLGLDLQGNHTFVNPAAARMLGYKTEELISLPGHSIWHHTKPDETPYPQEECKICAAYRDGTLVHECNEVFWRKDGTSFPIEYTSTPILEQGRLVGAVVTFSDITERKKADGDIRYLKDYNQNILESNPNPMMVIKGKQVEYVNKSFISIFGETKNEYIARNLKDVVPSEILPVFENLLQEEGRLTELKFKGKDFSVYSFVIKKAEEEEEEEEETRRGMIFQDISEHKRMEMAIEKSTRRYRELIEGNRDGYVMTDMDDKITECNSTFRRMIGYTDEELHKKTLKDITPQEWHHLSEKIIKEQILKTGYSEVYEKEIIGKNGRIFPVELRRYLLKENDKPVGIWSFVRDITDRKKTEYEIKEKVNTLEKYKNITVGRELRIIELKEKVKKLEKQLEARNA
jgi:PAS domain S-box-containing protein